MNVATRARRRSASDSVSPRDGKARPRVLIEAVHPADVLFFYHPIQRLRSRGCPVLVASRDKDVTISLLDELNIEHEPVSVAGAGLLQLGREMLLRDVALWRLAKRYSPDVMVGFGGTTISHVGALRSIPSVGFYDTDHARLQQWLTIPFIGWQYFPEVYDGPASKRRSSRFRGIKECSYLHPDNFSASRSRAVASGLSIDRPNILVRTVSWSSNHDLSRSGMSTTQLSELIKGLSLLGSVHLSAEGCLAQSLIPYRFKGASSDFHHLLAFCDLVVGESATVVAEAAMLGVPAIYWADDRRGYTDELARRGLVDCIRDASVLPVLDRARARLVEPRTGRKHLYQVWLKSVCNLAEFVSGAIEHHAYRDSAFRMTAHQP